MRKLLLAATALALLSTAPLQAQIYEPLTNALNGVGCPGSNGTPDLSSPDLPRTNAPFKLVVTNLPLPAPFVGGVGAFVYGFSKVQWGNFILPYDLGNLGVFNCFAHVAVDVIIPFVYSAPTMAMYTLPIPNDPSIVGVEFFNQCAFVDLLAQLTLGRQVTVSNAMQGVVGM